MNNFQEMKQLFNKIGLKFEIDNRAENKANLFKYREENIYYIITLDQGVGYSGFECQFYFDKEGKFINHGVYE